MPPKVIALTASGSNIEVSDIWIGSIAPFWMKSPMTSWAQTTTSGGLPAWLAVLNLVVRSWATASTWTVTPLSVAHFAASGLMAAARFSSAQMTRVAAPADGAAALASVDGAAALGAAALAAVLGAAEDPPLLQALMMTAMAANRTPSLLITFCSSSCACHHWSRLTA